MSYIYHFLTPDSIVPQSENPQSYNRYTYALNNPLKFIDPTGHSPVCDDNGTICSDGAYDDGTIWTPTQSDSVGYLVFVGEFTLEERAFALKAASKIANRMADTINPPLIGAGNIVIDGTMSPYEVFTGVFGGPITMKNVDYNLVDAAGYEVYAIASQTNPMITVGKKEISNHYLLIHEIFHIFDLVVLDGVANQALLDAQNNPNVYMPNRPKLEGPSDLRWGFAGGNFSEWQKSRSGKSGEEFADMGIGWVYNRWAATPAGRARAKFMDSQMALWTDMALSQ